MKHFRPLAMVPLLFLASCSGNFGSNFDSIIGKKTVDSRMFTSEEDFFGSQKESPFLPFKSSELQASQGDKPLPQPKTSPGQGAVPALTQFQAHPSFPQVHFETDEHVVKEKTDLQTLLQVAAYLKKHPQTYILVEGHTDERASASYNLALGVRRANQIRSLLVKHGIDPNRIYTVSKGKEKPLALGHTQEDWKQNRRAEFRVYEPR